MKSRLLTCFLRSLHDGRTSPRRDGGARQILWILWIRQRPSLLHEAREPLVGRLPWPACGQPVASLWPACGQPVASLWPACGQPVVILDDPSVRRFRELEQEVTVWSDRYPFIAELKGHSIRPTPNGSRLPPTTRWRSSRTLPATPRSTRRSSDALTTAEDSSTSPPTATSRTRCLSTRRRDSSTIVASRGLSRLLSTAITLFVSQA